MTSPPLNDFRFRKFSCQKKKWHFTLAVHLNVTRRRFLKNFVETFKKIWSNLRLRLGKKSIRYVTLHLIEGDACAQLRSVTEIASKSPFDMWTEILSGMIFVPAPGLSAFVWIWPQSLQPNIFKSSRFRSLNSSSCNRKCLLLVLLALSLSLSSLSFTV